MTEEKERKTKNQKWAAERLLMFIEVCPHVLKPETGAEQFIEDLNKAATMLNEDFKEMSGPMIDLLPFIKACPNIIKPEIGLEEFVKDLARATSKFNIYFVNQY